MWLGSAPKETAAAPPKASEVPKQSDGSVLFYYLDAFEQNGVVYMFGKVKDGDVYRSCCVRVPDMCRNMFLVLRDQDLDGEDAIQEAASAAAQEITNLNQKHQWHIFDDQRGLLARPCVRKNCFQREGLSQGDHHCLKLLYPFSKPALPANLSGATFSHVCGANQSAVELLLTKRKIKGPTWLRLMDTEAPSAPKSWCAFEVVIRQTEVDGSIMLAHKKISVAKDENLKDPPLSVMSLATRTILNKKNEHEVAMAACIFKPAINLSESVDQFFKGGAPQIFKIIRRFDGKPFPRNSEEIFTKHNVTTSLNEIALLNQLVAKVNSLDPDVIVAHNGYGSELEVIATRLASNGIPMWHKLSRLRREKSDLRVTMSGRYVVRKLTLGRLVCDTELAAREPLRETSYELAHLVKVRLKQDYKPLSPEGEHIPLHEQIPKCYEHGKSLCDAVDHAIQDAAWSLQLAWDLEVLPLNLQLTRVCGNLWCDSLQYLRAARNDSLLSHEFYSKKYLLPEAKEKERSDKKRQIAYSGGLVLDPVPGLYTDIVLCLDFMSLYPSLIREYNLCFTTVNDVNGDEIPDLPGSNAAEGVLPRVMAGLFEQRKAIKNVMKSEKDPRQKAVYDIRQKAYKLVANSMYGTLGFAASRYHAQGIAALITKMGRETLQTTVTLTKEVLKFDVIYGDTDSMFVCTRRKELPEARRVGALIAAEVNKKYKKLEIEVDDCYRRILLLKKKKYAGLKIIDWNDKGLIEQAEFKGIDSVRRDWCFISQKLGLDVARLLLQAATEEEAAKQIHVRLAECGKHIDDGTIGVPEYVITKGMQKMPHEYPDANAQPHVQVAKRLLEAGNQIHAGQEIPYVVTKTGASLAEKARHPDELARDPTLELDKEWYKSTQLHPVILRLCGPIESMDAATIAESLGLNPAKFSAGAPGAGVKAPPAEASENVVELGENANALFERMKKSHDWPELPCCPNCNAKLQCPVVFATNMCRSESCKKRGELLPVSFLHNALLLCIHGLMGKYCEQKLECDDETCRQCTQQVALFGDGTRCIFSASVRGRQCPGNVKQVFSDNDLLDHFRALKYATTGAVAIPDERVHPQLELSAMVTEAMSRCDFNFVSLKSLFAGMDKQTN
jgi:DNA polymerase alpha subunit A